MNEEEFQELLNQLARAVDSNLRGGYVTSITNGGYFSNSIETIGNHRTVRNSQLGTPYYQLRLNEESERIVETTLNNEDIVLQSTIAIDSSVINNDEIINALNRKIATMAEKPNVRIINSGYTLTEDDYNRLQNFQTIIVDNCVEELQENNKVIVQNGVYKYDYQAEVEPVIERKNNFEEMVTRDCFHIDHKLTDEEFEILREAIDNVENPSIELNVFEPSYYEEFFRKLQEHNIKNNINVCIIGYLLDDNINDYEGLNNYPYEIDVIYSTCHDVVNMYTQEPYVGNRHLYTQLEGSGKTTLSNYENILNELTSFADVVEERNFSPLEAAIYAKTLLDTQYIYDPDHANENTDDWDNTYLSQILNHNDGTHRRAICLGLATLFSAYLRKANIPMFSYGVTGHTRNIGRIVDEKYNLDTLAVFDVTWGLNNSDYTYFGLAPREMLSYEDEHLTHENMTIASCLALPLETYNALLPYTNDSYEYFYNPVSYDPSGYLARLLEITNLIPNTQEIFGLHNEIYRLNKEGYLEGVDPNIIIEAHRNVLNSIENVDEETINDLNDYVRMSLENRHFSFTGEPALGTDHNIYETYPVDALTPENIDHYIETYDETSDRIYRNSDYIRQQNEDQQVVEEEQIIEETPIEENHGETIIGEREPEENIEVNRQPAQTIEPEQAYNFMDEEISQEDTIDEYIPGTNIRKPRYRNLYETDEEYERFLENYYSRYFTEEQMNRGRR